PVRRRACDALRSAAAPRAPLHARAAQGRQAPPIGSRQSHSRHLSEDVMSNDRTQPPSSGRTRSAARVAVATLGLAMARRCGVAVPAAIVAFTAGMPLAQAGPGP